MATDQRYKIPYPRSHAGHQMYNVHTQSMANPQGHHLPNLTHSANSAFRHAGAPQVPLQQRLISPAVSPSGQEHYHHQQRLVPFSRNDKHALQLELQQKQQQQQQQHIFQNLPATSPGNTFQEISMHVQQRAAPNAVVQAISPVQYPPAMQQFSAVQGNSDQELLHQELRMLHAAHYQDLHRKDEVMETIWKQKMEVEQRQQAGVVHNATYDPQRKQYVTDSSTVYRKKIVEESHRTYGHLAQQNYLPKQEELYQARKIRPPMASTVSQIHPQMASYPRGHPETQMRFAGAVPQSVPPAHLVHGFKENSPTNNSLVGRPGDYQHYERYIAPQQFQTRYPRQGVLMQQRPVRHPHQEVFQNPKKQGNYPPPLHPANPIHPAVQRPKHSNVSLQYSPDVVLVRDDIEQVPVTPQSGSIRQERTVDKQASVAGRLCNLQAPVKQNRIQGEKVHYTDHNGKESKRLSNLEVSIREEQMQLKEVLEKSIHRAAVQSIHKVVKEDAKDPSDHIYGSSSASDMDSMPRIVKVRSLANHAFPGTAPVAPSSVSPGEALGSNLKHSKPKSVMIKAHQDLQEGPMNVNRVPSQGSMDSDNSRKDSWDSGIESPPWTDNREASVMNMKRAAAFLSDDGASLGIPHQSQKVLKTQSDKYIINQGLNLPGNDQTNNSSRMNMSQSVKESSMVNRRRIALCNSSPENSNRTRHLSADEWERRRHLVDRKRSWPSSDLCPLESKVANKDPHARDTSRLSREHKEDLYILSKEKISLKSQVVKSSVVKAEIPLDLSCKKDQVDTPSETKEIKGTQLDDNEVTIVKKSNVECEKSTGDIDDKIQKGGSCDAEVGNRTDAAANEPDGKIIRGAENQMKNFSNIMMRALKRLWSESKPSVDEEEAAKPKADCAESSDEDSGKYFQPSAATTLKQVPQVDSPDGSQRPVVEDPVKNALPSSSSSNPLESALCELMQQSSDAFKHGGDIFQHFDKIIKRELMVEMEKQHQKCDDEPTCTTTEPKKEENLSDLNEVKSDELTNEAVALCTNSPIDMISVDEEIDDSQNLVIVESSMSPKPSPDSQVAENKMEKDDTVPAQTSISFELHPSIDTDCSISESFASPGEMYEKAARDAAQKAAHEAARLAAKKAAQATSSMNNVGPGSSQTQSVVEVKTTCVEASLAQKTSSTVPHLVKVYPRVGGFVGPRMSLQQLQNNRRASSVLEVKQSQGLHPPQKPQFMGEDVPRSIDGGATVRHPPVERRLSEPAIFNYNSNDSTQKCRIQRMQSVDTTSTAPVKNIQNTTPSSVGQTYQIVPRTMWQAQTQENDPNKVKIIKVTCNSTIQIQAPPAATVVPNACDMQKQLQQSPIVILPKLVCVPGQTYSQNYSQSTPIVGTQTLPSRNVVILQKNDTQTISNASSVVKTVSVATSSDGGSQAVNTNNPPFQRIAPSTNSPDLTDTIVGPFRIIRKTPLDQLVGKKACVSAFVIIYKNISLPGVVRSGVPFVPPRLLQDGMFPDETFDNFCHALQDCNIMQRYMTVLERSALLNDLKTNKISSCKLVSLEEFHNKYDKIRVLMQMNKMN